MSYDIQFHIESKKELDCLDGRERLLVLKQLKKISENPFVCKDLGNKAELDLTGYKKIYVDNKKIRIVFKVIDNKMIVYVISIGKRDNLEVYKNAMNRI